ncbi:hypothetical protein NicSoilB8_36560 [Arthrobacter sp. NicSoilB8]|nr:hypothetical protein NicSoilB8_36560 [Arthrobacter sp. NicSoilB8]
MVGLAERFQDDVFAGKRGGMNGVHGTILGGSGGVPGRAVPDRPGRGRAWAGPDVGPSG